MVTDSDTVAVHEELNFSGHHNLVVHINGECQENEFHGFWNVFVISHPFK